MSKVPATEFYLVSVEAAAYAWRPVHCQADQIKGIGEDEGKRPACHVNRKGLYPVMLVSTADEMRDEFTRQWLRWQMAWRSEDIEKIRGLYGSDAPYVKAGAKYLASLQEKLDALDGEELESADE